MKKLMMTTAIVAVTSLGAIAQTAAPAPEAQGQDQVQAQGQMQGQTQGQMVPAFLSSDFTGMDLYALDHDAMGDAQVGDGMAGQPGVAPDAQPGTPGYGYQDRSARWTSSDAFMSQRDAWNNIGNISDVVMTQDGEIRGVIVDIGGFLGMFAHTVMIDLDNLYFVADEGATTGMTGGDGGVRDFFVVASLSREQLEALPEWDDAHLTAGFEPRFQSMGQQPMGQQQMDQQQMGQAGQQAPAEQQAEMMTPGHSETTMQPDQAGAMQPAGDATAGDATAGATADANAQQQPATDGAFTGEGYTELPMTDERTADALTGANVYDAAEDNIGTVTDLVLDDDASISHILVDVGGFLGMGSHTVALDVDNVAIMWNDQNDDVRVHVQTTRDELEAMPEYQG